MTFDQRIAETGEDKTGRPTDSRRTAGSMRFDLEWRVGLSRAIAESGKSRAQIAAEMTALLPGERPITKMLLDAWTASSRHAWRMPVTALPAFIRVTGAFWLVEALALLCGRIAITQEDERDLALGRAAAKIERLRRLERALLDDALSVQSDRAAEPESS